MPFRIVGEALGPTNVKRFYLPGVKAMDECAKCNRTIEIGYSDHYLSDPVAGDRCKIYFWCEDCDYEWEQEAVLKISLVSI
jgi:hypothetical protein